MKAEARESKQEIDVVSSDFYCWGASFHLCLEMHGDRDCTALTLHSADQHLGLPRHFVWVVYALQHLTRSGPACVGLEEAEGWLERGVGTGADLLGMDLSWSASELERRGLLIDGCLVFKAIVSKVW